MSTSKSTPTPRRSPLKQTTVDRAMEMTFGDALARHIRSRDWEAVKNDFLWLGQYFEWREG